MTTCTHKSLLFVTECKSTKVRLSQPDGNIDFLLALRDNFLAICSFDSRCIYLNSQP